MLEDTIDYQSLVVSAIVHCNISASNKLIHKVWTILGQTLEMFESGRKQEVTVQTVFLGQSIKT